MNFIHNCTDMYLRIIPHHMNDVRSNILVREVPMTIVRHHGHTCMNIVQLRHLPLFMTFLFFHSSNVPRTFVDFTPIFAFSSPQRTTAFYYLKFTSNPDGPFPNCMNNLFLVIFILKFGFSSVHLSTL